METLLVLHLHNAGTPQSFSPQNGMFQRRFLRELAGFYGVSSKFFCSSLFKCFSLISIVPAFLRLFNLVPIFTSKRVGLRPIGGIYPAKFQHRPLLLLLVSKDVALAATNQPKLFAKFRCKNRPKIGPICPFVFKTG